MDEVLADLEAPDEPSREACGALLGELARMCAAGGWERFARPPVAPDGDAFPDRWEPTPEGVATIAQRLCAHAGVDDLAVTIVDRRGEAGVQGKKVTTELELVEVTAKGARFDLYSIGDDAVVGTIAHEVGAALAPRWRTPDAPYRGVASSEIDHDARWRGSIAAVYAGLGVPAANAAFQEYKLGRYQAHLGYAPVEYEVVKAGQLTVDELGFLLAVQAVAQGAPAPRGLGGVQLDAVHAWMEALAERGGALRALCGMPEGQLARPAPAPLPPGGAIVVAGEHAKRARRVYRVPGSRAGVGVLVGMVVGGLGAGVLGARSSIPFVIGGGALIGAAVGKRSRFDRCSSCVHLVPLAAPACPHCGGEVAGLLTSRADALDLD
jgi:hypothetical protein